MNMLSPLIWVWPAGSIRKVLFPGRLLARAELSGLGFTPVPHSQGFYFEAASLFPPPRPPRHVWQAELDVGCSPDYKNHSSVPSDGQIWI